MKPKVWTCDSLPKDTVMILNPNVVFCRLAYCKEEHIEIHHQGDTYRIHKNLTPAGVVVLKNVRP